MSAATMTGPAAGAEDAVRLVYEPRAFLVGGPSVRHEGLNGFLSAVGAGDWTTDAGSAGEALAEVAGRVCYASFRRPRPGGNAAYLAHLIESGHGSVLEHAVFHLVLTGVSRSFSHELVRHRHLSFAQLSQRYVDESDVAFVVPPALAAEVDRARLTRSGAGAHWVAAAETALRVYRELAGALFLAAVNRHFPRDGVETAGQAEAWAGRMWAGGSGGLVTGLRKAAREAARSVLPNCAETRIFVTGNARAWRGFVDQRATPHADAEMCRAAVLVLKALRAEAPNLFGDYKVWTCDDDRECAGTDFKKV